MDAWKKMLANFVLDALEKLVTPDFQQKADEWVVARLRAEVAKTENEIDDRLVEIVAKALGVPQ